jgi:hypothetical protein
MRFMHRSPVVALGALCLVACLSLLPATSGAFPIRWTDTGDTVPGDPDGPGGSLTIKLPFLQLDFLITRIRSSHFAYFVIVPIAHSARVTARGAK